MGIAEELERRLEKAVEGLFGKAFRSGLQPAEIGRRLLREMEGAKRVSVGAVYVPNIFEIKVATADYERLEGLIPTLVREFRDLLKQNARERRWRLPSPPRVLFVSDPLLGEGKFDVSVAIEDTGDEVATAEPVPTVRLVGADPEQVWELAEERLVIGRSSECEIVIADANASRKHAEFVKRNNAWWIVDLASTNGTLVNESFVKERRLETSDMVRIGTTELLYREGEDEATAL